MRVQNPHFYLNYIPVLLGSVRGSRALQSRLYLRTIVTRPGTSFFATLTLPKCCPSDFSKPRRYMGDDITRFDGSVMTVQIKEDDGESFMCDEEPHMLAPEFGYGYNPLTLGETLEDGKYVVVRKLGWGQFSSVWLARDISAPDVVNKYVAVKVLTINESYGVYKYLIYEVETLRLIKQKNPQHRGYKHCVILRETFLARSYHGPHVCIATDLLGTDIQSLQRSQPTGKFTLPIVKRIIKQTLFALEYLHVECRVVHTDVKPGNTLISIAPTDEQITEYIKQNPSATYEPRIEPDLSPDPIITVKSQPLPNFGLDPSLSNLEIRLADYGAGNPIDKPPRSEEAQPVLLRAPEILLGHPWSTPVDIWSIGCLIFEYLTSTALFQLHKSSTRSFTDVHLERIAEHIGPFPPEFLAACSKRAEYFDDAGSLLRIPKLSPQALEECFRLYIVMSETDLTETCDFMRRCLTINPSARPTASELLEDKWLKE